MMTKRRRVTVGAPPSGYGHELRLSIPEQPEYGSDVSRGRMGGPGSRVLG